MLYRIGLLWCVSGIAVALPSAGLAQPSTGETDLAAKLQCNQFKKSPDGSWTAGGGAQLDGANVAGQVFKKEDHVAIALDQKCTAKK